MFGISHQRREEFDRAALVHVPELLRVAARLCGSADAGEDLLQETYLQAWRSFHRFESGTNCRAWLYKILLYSYSARNRKRARQPFHRLRMRRLLQRPARRLSLMPKRFVPQMEALMARKAPPLARHVMRHSKREIAGLLDQEHVVHAQKAQVNLLGEILGVSAIFQARGQVAEPFAPRLIEQLA